MKQNIRQNKEEPSEKKVFLKFMGILVLSAFGGFIAAFGGMYTSNVISDLHWNLEKIMPVVRGVTFFIWIAANIITFGICMYVWLREKKQAQKWDGEDEEEISQIEKHLDIVNVINNIWMIGNFFVFSVLVQIDRWTSPRKEIKFIVFIMGIFVLTTAATILVQKLVVDFKKQLNPEKRGSVFDINFEKRWEESCDEAEKMLMYRAGYKAFRMTNKVCSIMWALTFTGMMTFDTGLFPQVCVMVIWLTLITSYMVIMAKQK